MLGTVFKIGGSMISFAYTAYSIASSYYSLPPLAPWDKQSWAGVGIGFIIFTGFVFWGWAEASIKLKKHENSHPNSTGNIRCEKTSVYFDVKNTGHGTGKFRVQVLESQNLKSSPALDSAYNLRWLNNLYDPMGRSYELIPNEKNSMIIIDSAGSADTDGNEGSLQNILLPSCTVERKAVIPAGSVIHITLEITSEPKLTTVFRYVYALSITNTGKWELLGEDNICHKKMLNG